MSHQVHRRRLLDLRGCNWCTELDKFGCLYLLFWLSDEIHSGSRLGCGVLASASEHLSLDLLRQCSQLGGSAKIVDRVRLLVDHIQLRLAILLNRDNHRILSQLRRECLLISQLIEIQIQGFDAALQVLHILLHF